jgi:ring-1,2-phenylacetyl-CoA epoxidase subunit PaaC
VGPPAVVRDAQLAAIAGRSLKEVRYHLRHSHDWLVRLGDGTDESHQRAQAALDHLLPGTQEFWVTSPAEQAAQANGTGVATAALRDDWTPWSTKPLPRPRWMARTAPAT